MISALRHRGPDDEGAWSAGPAALGHARLSVIDLAAGHQPLTNEDQTLWITYNGEIYNFAPLREELIARGHVFRTRCDTEVILHLYEEAGEKCLDRLNGMFAFAIWDSRKQSLFMARDRLGIKPLHYAIRDGRMIFASEIKSILAHGNVPRSIDPEAMCEYLSFLCVGAPRTMFQGIRKLPPGHWLRYDRQGLRVQSYWDLSPSEASGLDPSQIERELRDRLSESIRLQLVSDVPVAAFLSGGVDSSSVVALMSSLSATPPTTVTAAFDDGDYDESIFARRVAERYHTLHHEESVHADAVEITRTLAWHFDEPFADYSAVPTYCVSRAARRHAKVALSGDGGDECFAGYTRYRWHMSERRIRRFLPAWLRRWVLGPLARLLPTDPASSRPVQARRTLLNIAMDPAAAYALTMSDFRQPASLLTGDFLRTLGGFCPWHGLADSMNRFGGGPLETLLYADTKHYLPDDILAKVDRASMAVSLEVRVPMLDHTLVEFAHRIPVAMKLRGREGKLILKSAMKPYLDAQTLHRPKHGFEPPVESYLRGPLKEMAADLLLAAAPAYGQYVRKDVVERLWREHQQGTHNHVGMIWTVLMLELWARNFLM
jgi:asparagine synthase (glutamine-hydrolysing)